MSIHARSYDAFYIVDLAGACSLGGKGRYLLHSLLSKRSKQLSAPYVIMVNAPFASPTQQAEDSSVLINLRHSLKQVCLRTTLL